MEEVSPQAADFTPVSALSAGFLAAISSGHGPLAGGVGVVGLKLGRSFVLGRWLEQLARKARRGLLSAA
jgi:hypothetical protein